MIRYLTIGGVVISLLTTSFSAEGQVKLRLSHAAGKGSSEDIGLNQLAALIREASKGSIQTEVSTVTPASNLFDELVSGRVSVAVLYHPQLIKTTPEFEIFNVPFVFGDRHHVDAILLGDVGSSLLTKTADSRIVALAFWERGFLQLSTASRVVKGPGDMKGLRLAVSPRYELTFKMLGADPVVIPFAQVFKAIKTGQIEGVEIGIQDFVTRKLYEVQKVLNLTSHRYVPLVVVANRNVYDSLSEEARRILREAAVQAGGKQRATLRGAELSALKESQGLVKISPIDSREAFVRALAPSYGTMERKLGEQFVRSVLKPGATCSYPPICGKP